MGPLLAATAIEFAIRKPTHSGLIAGIVLMFLIVVFAVIWWANKNDSN
jgi:uncharacterized integral membrane protein